MELNQLFKIQEIMENNIKKQANMDEDALGRENVIELRFLAFQVKLSEIANLTKCYKYFTIKSDIPKEKLMIRYIDATKFLLSIGNAHLFNIINRETLQKTEDQETIIKLFSVIFDHVTDLKQAILKDDYMTGLSVYIHLFSHFIELGEVLGLDFEEVYQYYESHYCGE